MRTIAIKLLYLFLFTSGMFIQLRVQAQCTTTINLFPYNEGFESSNGLWTPSSPLHWAWGAPAGKAVIAGAGSGSKCWIAGGLSGSSYSSGSSELVSPCFDFTNLYNPEISFKAFWETELRFDGVTMQFSVDNGSSWITLGNANSNDPCAGIENWFNYASINFVSGEPGWSGNVQTGGGSCLTGQGSGQWLTARHSLSALAGEANVIFKFVFGAGQICNDFDGFAIDDIHIGEAPAAGDADFTYSCGGNNSAQFTNTLAACQVAWSWNFGDPASGNNNMSSLQNPAHVFSAAGSYNVSLVVTYASGNQVIVPPKVIVILNVETTHTDITCNGDANGTASVSVSPAGNYIYSWNSSPPQTTAIINNLTEGTYNVTVTGTNTCTVSVPVSITQPAPLVANPIAEPAKCGNNNGSIAANATGGNQPYLYTWSNGQTSAVINNLAAGEYDLLVSDVNGCNALPVNNISVLAVTKILKPFIGNDTTICPGQMLLLNPGTYTTYKWQDNSTAAVFHASATGTYIVEVTDNDGCSGSDSLKLTVDCRGIHFPSAFTPGSDALNSSFGALGDLSSLKDFSIIIYNRFAQVVFSSSDPYHGWDGTYKGKPLDTQAFVWTAKYTLPGQQPIFKKGSVMIVR